MAANLDRWNRLDKRVQAFGMYITAAVVTLTARSAPELDAAIAAEWLLQRDLGAATSPLAPKPPHFAPKAKRVIFLFMVGAPSSIDMFDPNGEQSLHQMRLRGSGL